MAPNPITVFFIGRNDMFHRMLEIQLSHRGINVQRVLTAEEDFNLQHATACDIIVVDVEDLSYGFAKFGMLHKVLETFPDSKVIAVTDGYSSEVAETVKPIGAKGYFPRSVPNYEVISDCISIVHNGGICFGFVS